MECRTRPGRERRLLLVLFSSRIQRSKQQRKGVDLLSSGIFLTVTSSLIAHSLRLTGWSPACCSGLPLRPIGRTAEESLHCLLSALYIAALQRGHSSSALSQLLFTNTQLPSSSTHRSAIWDGFWDSSKGWQLTAVRQKGNIHAGCVSVAEDFFMHSLQGSSPQHTTSQDLCWLPRVLAYWKQATLHT